MTPGISTALAIASFASQLQPQVRADAMLALAARGPDSAIVAEARKHPDDTRLALGLLFSLAASARDEPTRTGHLAGADKLATAYAVAWEDSFLQQQVARFRRWSLPDQRRKVAADRLRRAGNAALGSAGPSAALRLWRRSLSESIALGDSSGRAATLGNIGAGFLQATELDSAETYFERSRRLAQVLGDHRTAGNAIGSLGSVQLERGALRKAREFFGIAVTVRPKSGDSRGEAADRNNLGRIQQILGDWTAAQRDFEAALALNLRERRSEPAALNLINLANLTSQVADFSRAKGLYRRALTLYRSEGNRLGAALALYNIGLLESSRGDYPRARAFLLEALAIYSETGPVADEITTRRDLAAVEAELGNLDGALGQLREGEARATASGAHGAALAGLALTRADLAVTLNQLGEAQHWYDRAAGAFRLVGDERGVADAEEGLALLQLFREDFPAARRTLAAIARRQVATKDRRGEASTALLLGHAMERQGDTAGARRSYSAVRATYAAIGDPVGTANALGTLGELEAAGGNWQAAEHQFRQGITSLGSLPAPVLGARLHAGLGAALRNRGALEEAGRELGLAIAETERVAGTLRVDERRAGFLSDKWDPYAELALLEHARGKLGAAFVASERLRSRQMRDLLARGHITLPPGVNDSLAIRAQDLRRQITDLTRILAPVSLGTGTLRGANVSATASEHIREALAEAQRAYSDLLLVAREKSPLYQKMVSPETATWSTVAAALRPDEALLEYLVTDSTTLVFVVSHDSLTVLDLGVGRQTLASLVDFTRSALTRPASQRTASALWRAPLMKLHAWLWAPVERSGLLRGKRSLVVVPHAELHYLPFGALLDEGARGFVAAHYALTYTPSATVWLSLGKRHRGQGRDAILALAPQPQGLPATPGEVAAIQEVFGTRATVLLGDLASESNFRGAAASKTIIHLATYGVLNKHNPLFSFVELAPSASDDGRLEVHEIFGLTLQARLVVLSACQTGLGSGALADVPAGDDWVGMVRAFLSAGTSEVLATLWPVEDRATAQLMTAFYRAMGGGASDAVALVSAQRAALRDPRTADPFYWAGFTLVGAGAR